MSQENVELARTAIGAFRSGDLDAFDFPERVRVAQRLGRTPPGTRRVRQLVPARPSMSTFVRQSASATRLKGWSPQDTDGHVFRRVLSL
jgi:hypothetical protein